MSVETVVCYLILYIKYLVFMLKCLFGESVIFASRNKQSKN